MAIRCGGMFSGSVVSVNLYQIGTILSYLNLPYDYAPTNKAIWCCAECGDERVYGDTPPEQDSNVLLMCQKQSVLKMHVYVRMSSIWVGKKTPLGPGWAVTSGQNGRTEPGNERIQ